MKQIKFIDPYTQEEMDKIYDIIGKTFLRRGKIYDHYIRKEEQISNCGGYIP